MYIEATARYPVADGECAADNLLLRIESGDKGGSVLQFFAFKLCEGDGALLAFLRV